MGVRSFYPGHRTLPLHSINNNKLHLPKMSGPSINPSEDLRETYTLRTTASEEGSSIQHILWSAHLSSAPSMAMMNQDMNLSSEDRLEKSRERNREHAKQTRLRKKNHLDAMKSRLQDLQDEATKLQQLLDENNTANILLCLSVANNSTEDESPSFEFEAFKGDLVDQLKHSVRVEAADKRKIFTPADAIEEPKKVRRNSDLTESSDSDPCQDEKQRKERNRMHAKLTRDRKKLFTTKISQMISKLEKQNKLMYQKLVTSQSHHSVSGRYYSSGTDDSSENGANSSYSRDDSPRDVWSDSNDNQSL